jgi:hypothetical protein
MTARWNATRDASDLRGQATDDAVGDLYADRDEWPFDDRPTLAEVERDEWGDDDDD